MRGARAPRGTLPPPRWTQPALGERQLPAVTASGVRGAGAWGPGCLRLETQRPRRERPARVSVLIAFFIFYICGRLDVLGLCGPGEGWCESRAHAISHLPYQTLTSPLPRVTPGPGTGQLGTTHRVQSLPKLSTPATLHSLPCHASPIPTPRNPTEGSGRIFPSPACLLPWCSLRGPARHGVAPSSQGP